MTEPAPKKRQRTPGSGRKPILQAEKVAAALVTFRGNLSAVARECGVQRASVQEFIGKNDRLKSILHDAREGVLDDAESALYSSVINREAWAVCFLLKTQGKQRGYVERTETRSVSDADIEREIESELARLAAK